MIFNPNNTWEIYKYNKKNQKDLHISEDLLAKGQIDFDYIYDKMAEMEKYSKFKVSV